jgi:hypothetical protein
MIRTLFLQSLGPALVLALGGLLLWLLSWLVWRHAVIRRTLTPLRLRAPAALLIVAVAGWLWVRIGATPNVPDLAWRWQPLTVAGATLHWRVEPWNWLVVLLILLLTAALILLGDDDPPAMPSAGALERTLWLAAAAALFVCSTNMITVASSWLVLDAALILRLYPGRQTEPAGRTWGLLMMNAPLLLFVLAMLGEAGLPAALVGGRFGYQELALLWGLGLLRVGVYPLHLWLTSPGRVGAGARTAVHLLGPATGIWFLARIQELAGPSLTRRPEWAALGALAILATALAAWTAEQGLWRWRWIAINRSSVVLLAAYVSGVLGPQAFAWPLVAFGLGCALLAAGLKTQDGRMWRVPTAMGALVLWGAPGTVGFVAQSVLIFPTELALAIPLFVVVLIGEILLAAALWEAVRSAGADPSTESAPARAPVPLRTLMHVGLVTIVLAVPAITWGMFPQRLAAIGGLALPDGAFTLVQFMTTARRSVWIGLALSGLGGAALGIWRRQIFGQMRGWQQAIGAIVSLEWLYQALVAGLRLVGSGLQYFATLGEGEGYLGWLALAGLILWVLLRG